MLYYAQAARKEGERYQMGSAQIFVSHNRHDNDFCTALVDACYDQALAIDPKDVDFWNNKGNTLNALGRREEAEVAWKRAKELGYVG